MIFKTEEELKTAFRTAAQTEMLLSQDGSVPAFVLPEDIATMRYVLDTLMPQIKDLRTRRIIWLRSQGLCWKIISNELKLSQWQVRTLFKNAILVINAIEKENS